MAVKSAERVLDILEFLSCYPNGLTGKEISQKMSWAGSSTFELLKTLTERGYLIVDDNRRYRLSVKIVDLGMNVMPMTRIGRVASPYIKRAMEILGDRICGEGREYSDACHTGDDRKQKAAVLHGAWKSIARIYGCGDQKAPA